MFPPPRLSRVDRLNKQVPLRPPSHSSPSSEYNPLLPPAALFRPGPLPHFYIYSFLLLPPASFCSPHPPPPQPHPAALFRQKPFHTSTSMASCCFLLLPATNNALLTRTPSKLLLLQLFENSNIIGFGDQLSQPSRICDSSGVTFVRSGAIDRRNGNDARMIRMGFRSNDSIELNSSTGSPA